MGTLCYILSWYRVLYSPTHTHTHRICSVVIPTIQTRIHTHTRSGYEQDTGDATSVFAKKQTKHLKKLNILRPAWSCSLYRVVEKSYLKVTRMLESSGVNFHHHAEDTHTCIYIMFSMLCREFS